VTGSFAGASGFNENAGGLVPGHFFQTIQDSN
jgi:hypothetical protein